LDLSPNFVVKQPSLSYQSLNSMLPPAPRASRKQYPYANTHAHERRRKCRKCSKDDVVWLKVGLVVSHRIVKFDLKAARITPLEVADADLDEVLRPTPHVLAPRYVMRQHARGKNVQSRLRHLTDLLRTVLSSSKRILAEVLLRRAHRICDSRASNSQAAQDGASFHEGGHLVACVVLSC
jgi:hypothetical protein